nr:p25 protein [Cucurbit yellow stunting disorder virus]WFP36073.1 MAG: p25 protein [Cucurbit yellow stunting disorder virus]
MGEDLQEQGNRLMTLVEINVHTMKSLMISHLDKAQRIFEDCSTFLLDGDIKNLKYRGNYKLFKSIFKLKLPKDVIQPMEDYLVTEYKQSQVVLDLLRARALIFVLKFLKTHFTDLYHFQDLEVGDSVTINVFETFIEEVFATDLLDNVRHALLNTLVEVKIERRIPGKDKFEVSLDSLQFFFTTETFSTLNEKFFLRVKPYQSYILECRVLE